MIIVEMMSWPVASRLMPRAAVSTMRDANRVPSSRPSRRQSDLLLWLAASHGFHFPVASGAWTSPAVRLPILVASLSSVCARTSGRTHTQNLLVASHIEVRGEHFAELKHISIPLVCSTRLINCAAIIYVIMCWKDIARCSHRHGPFARARAAVGSDLGIAIWKHAAEDGKRPLGRQNHRSGATRDRLALLVSTIVIDGPARTRRAAFPFRMWPAARHSSPECGPFSVAGDRRRMCALVSPMHAECVRTTHVHDTSTTSLPQ
ncbi:hypothetical protein L227DRAFT_363419 [Lentinus tigrinus ALCF2SS1-6]|uniref:Uncharacterized protein n=1 Tax=Lentinus tigrinus ALCF2SS1-6 TaxID=1328759 RepID=A0A5C2SL27_9APHY|nr:hypothetical protein L227DRAFT_363419 [Lentinus tigrinus ALCF2SS1-6]